MKNLLWLVLFTIGFTFTLTAQDEVVKPGIKFTKAPWSSILTKAKKEEKIIFIDAYTTWCGPCKKMDRQVFNNRQVGNFFNEKFINLKLNMEKGEGPALGDKYDVIAYPTLLFISPEGDILHRTAGFASVPQLIEIGEVATNPELRLATMADRYESGDRNPDFLYKYAVMRLRAADNSHKEIAEAYLKTQTDLTSPENIDFIYNFLDDADSKMFDYLIANKDKFEQVYGKGKVAGKIQNLIYAKLDGTINRSTLEQIDNLFLKAYPLEAKEMSSRFRMTYYRQAGDLEKYLDAVDNHLSNFKPKGPDELNDIAWTYYEMVDDKKQLKKAVKWAQQSIKMDDNRFNNDTLASLYYKLGKKKKAQKTAQHAIDIARRNGEDYSETQRLMDMILEM